MNILKNGFKYYLVLFIALNLGGCIIVKHPPEPEPTPTVLLSPKPDYPMSGKLIRSKSGDMIAFLPKDWFLVDVTDEISSDIIAVAVNPDYTLSAVFSQIKSSDNIDNIYAKEGLLGLSRIGYAMREKKTAGAVRQVGKYSIIKFGKKSFGQFEFIAIDATESAFAAVFKSELNQYYQFSLAPMNFTNKTRPAKDEVQRIFKSILTTIDF